MNPCKVCTLTLTVCVLVISSCSTINEMENSKDVVADFAGEFDSNFHSDGTMKFTLYDDGSMNGSWVTERNTVTLNVDGNYIIRENSIVMYAYGKTFLRSEIEADVIIIAVGEYSETDSSGKFTIVFSNPQFPIDDGTWSASIL